MAVVAGERRIVTVLFADIVGSTAIAERLGAERSKFLIDEVMRLMSEQVTHLEGTVAQYVGDELYAVFGAPIANEDDSERAVFAALAIQRAVADYADQVRDAYGVELAVRISINTGPVVIRADSDDPYNALGDTVNVAARLQELAAGGEVVVGPATKANVEYCFGLEPLGEHELAGRSAPVDIFRITGVREQQEESPGPLIGREFELAVLERTMESLLEGRGAIVSIFGEAGIGKSRIVAEMCANYSGRARFLSGRCVSYAHSLPYWPIRELLREWLAAGASAPEARIRLDLKTELGVLLGDDAADVFPFLATLLGLTLEPESAQRLGELSRESLQYETVQAFSDLVCALAEQNPLCLVLEDLHWADESTIELLEEILPLTERAPLALFLVSRGDRDHRSWSLGERARQWLPHRYREIELGPLPPDATRLLAEQWAEGRLPESVSELLLERAGGNPFFLEEALRDLSERDVLRRDNGSWVLAVDRHELTIPALVEGTLQARIDRLDEPTRDVLSLAATIGRTFEMKLLELLVPTDQLLPALSELQRLGLIVEHRRRPRLEYRFRQGLMQEVAYTRLIESKRRKLHARIGAALETIDVEASDETYGMLARHFSEADDAEKAAHYLLRAGDAARALYADREALEHYRRARSFLSRLDDEDRARDTLFKIALTHHLGFDFVRAEDAYDEAFCCRVTSRPVTERTERIETAVASTLPELMPGGSYTEETQSVLRQLFRGLVMVDADMNVVPAAADNFRVSGDGTTYLFRLRDGLRWCDGEPVTADDFVYGWRHSRDEPPGSFLLEDVDSIRAVDDWTLEIRLVEPRSYFLYVLACGWLHPWPRHKVESLGEGWRLPENLVTNGPFALADLSDTHALLRANPFWTGSHGNVREVRMELDVSEAESCEGWRDGRFDVIEIHDGSLAEHPDTLEEIVSGYDTHYVSYDLSKPPFSNRLVRQAFSTALARGSLLSEHVLARPARRGGMLPPAMPGHAQRVLPEHDLDVARRLLADAGFPGGEGLPELNFYVPSGHQADTSRFIAQWAQLGARIETVIYRVPHMRFPDDAHLRLSGWVADYPDPDGFFRGLVRQPYNLLGDGELEELLDDARAIRDPAERIRRYHEIDRLLVVDRALVLPVAYGRSMILRRPWVADLRTHPMTGIAFDEARVTRA